MQYKTRKKIKTDFIINEWQKSNIDVSRFFKDIPEIYIYKCLETGCGQGDFLKRLQDNNVDVTGIEFNEEAMRKSKEKGLNIYKETIQEHAKTHQNQEAN